MKRATLVLAALALLVCGVGQAKAGFLSPHGEATISGYTGGGGHRISLNKYPTIRFSCKTAQPTVATDQPVPSSTLIQVLSFLEDKQAPPAEIR